MRARCCFADGYAVLGSFMPERIFDFDVENSNWNRINIEWSCGSSQNIPTHFINDSKAMYSNDVISITLNILQSVLTSTFTNITLNYTLNKLSLRCMMHSKLAWVFGLINKSIRMLCTFPEPKNSHRTLMSNENIYGCTTNQKKKEEETTGKPSPQTIILWLVRQV